jgi:hypothetical protein
MLAFLSRLGYILNMLGFFFKKAFFDGWDHLFSLVLLNMAFLGLLALGIFLPSAFPAGSAPFFACLVAVILLASVWWATCVYALVAVADYGSMQFKDILPTLKKALVPGLQFGGLSALLVIALSIGLPFYFSKGGYLGAAAGGLLLWCAIFFFLAFQWFLPLRARFGGGFVKNMKKCFIFTLDNGVFSLFMFFYNLVTLVLSVILALLLPGFAGMALALDDGIRLRVLKYDWREQNPQANPKEVPWDALLVEEKELVGKRSFRGMIFPWKE